MSTSRANHSTKTRPQHHASHITRGHQRLLLLPRRGCVVGPERLGWCAANCYDTDLKRFSLGAFHCLFGAFRQSSSSRSSFLSARLRCLQRLRVVLPNLTSPQRFAGAPVTANARRLPMCDASECGSRTFRVWFGALQLHLPMCISLPSTGSGRLFAGGYPCC